MLCMSLLFFLMCNVVFGTLDNNISLPSFGNTGKAITLVHKSGRKERSGWDLIRIHFLNINPLSLGGTSVSHKGELLKREARYR